MVPPAGDVGASSSHGPVDEALSVAMLADGRTGEHSETAVYRDGDGNVDVERAAELITLVLALDCRGAQDAQAPCNRSLITDGHMPLRRRRHIATLVELLAQL
eukprot:1811146-Prymnesium_polylepis.3